MKRLLLLAVLSSIALPADGQTNTFPASGDVGIGTISPSRDLDIVDNHNGYSEIGLSNNSTGTGAGTIIRQVNSAGTNFTMQLKGGAFTTVGMSRQDGAYMGTGGAGGLTLNTEAIQPIYFGINSSEVMRVDTSGRLGIGTTSPANTLDIGTGGGIHITSGVPGSTNNALYNNAGTLTWNGSALATETPSSVILSAGQLQCSGSNCSNSTGSGTIQYCPYKGNIKTTASQGNYTIPGACLTATLTSMYVGGTASSSVAASTLYYIYLWNTSGTWVLDAETTGHATDSTTGIEIESGDDTKTLVGMIHTNSGKKVMTLGETTSGMPDTNTVATWDNRVPTVTRCGFTATRTSSASSGQTEINSENRCYFMSWGDGASFSTNITGYSNTAAAGFATDLNLNGVGTGFPLIIATGLVQSTANAEALITGNAMSVVREGYNYTVLSAQVNAGTTVTYYGGTPSQESVFTIQ